MPKEKVVIILEKITLILDTPRGFGSSPMLIFTCVLTYINNRFLFFISLELTTDLVAAYKNHSYERNKFLYIKKIIFL